MQWIERLVRELAKVEKTSKHIEFVLPAYADKGDSLTSAYPFPFMLWVPLWAREGSGSDGVLLWRGIRLALAYARPLGIEFRVRPSGVIAAKDG